MKNTFMTSLKEQNEVLFYKVKHSLCFYSVGIYIPVSFPLLLVCMSMYCLFD